MELTGYSTLWKAVIRPPKCEYNIEDMGPTEFIISNTRVTRTDIEIVNVHGHKL